MAPLGKMKTKRSRTCIGCCYYTAQFIYGMSSSCTIFEARGENLQYVILLLFLKIRTTQNRVDQEPSVILQLLHRTLFL